MLNYKIKEALKLLALFRELEQLLSWMPLLMRTFPNSGTLLSKKDYLNATLDIISMDMNGKQRFTRSGVLATNKWKHFQVVTRLPLANNVTPAPALNNYSHTTVLWAFYCCVNPQGCLITKGLLIGCL